MEPEDILAMYIAHHGWNKAVKKMLKAAYAHSYPAAVSFAAFVNQHTNERFSDTEVDMLCVEVDRENQVLS